MKLSNLLSLIVVITVAPWAMAEGNFTALSYVQNGLVTQWDGIDNAGTGAHDGSATVWKDLVGNVDLTLQAGGSWGENYLDANGFAAVGTNAAPTYRAIDVAFRKTSNSGGAMFSSGRSNDQVLFFVDSTSAICNYYWYTSTARGYFKPYNAESDWSLAVSYIAEGWLFYTNGVATSVGSTSGAYNWDNVKTGLASVGAWKQDNGDWVGRVYGIRLYNRTLTAGEVAYNAAVDAVRFRDVAPADAFTGELRWNAQTQKPEGHVVASVTKGTGSFTINGVATNEVWMTAGETVTLVYVPAEGETPLSWSGLPSDAAVSADVLTATFTVSGSFTPAIQMRTVFDGTGSLLADGGFEEGAGYVYDGGHQYGWANRWSRSSSNASLEFNSSGSTARQFSYLKIYQTHNVSQSGIPIPAGDYVLSFDYCKNSSTVHDAYFRVKNESGTQRTLYSLVTDAQRDGTSWHTVQIDVTFAEDGIYTFTAGASRGGNNTVYLDNIILKSKTDLTIDEIPDQPFLGETVRPQVVVRDTNGVALVEGTDYELQWGKNAGVGNGYVAAVGKGTHYGVAGANFRIGKVFYVSPEGTSSGDGTNWTTAVDFETVLAKVASRSTPTEVWIAGSNVLQAAVVERRFYCPILFRGGFAGYEGSPDERTEGAVSTIDGQGLYDAMKWKGFPNTSFERIRFRGCPAWALKRTSSYQGGVRISDCEFSDNGTTSGGGSIYVGSPNCKEKFVATGCRFSGNDVSRPYGNGAALYVTVGPAALTNCTFENFVGSATASVVYMTGADTASTVDHCLFQNNAVRGPSVSVARSASTTWTAFTHCTFAHNTGVSTSLAAALHASKGSVSVRDSIFSDNSNGAISIGADICCSGNAPCDLDYTMLDADDISHLALGSAASVKGTHLIVGDPRFVSATDAHLLSEAGYFDATGGLHYAEEDVISPAVDGGDPASPYANEPQPNGSRVNLGFYGNTAQASLSMFGPDTPSDYPHPVIRAIKSVTAVGCTVSYRINYTGVSDLYVCYGEDSLAPAYTNVIESAARIGAVTLTGLRAGVDYTVRLHARTADGRAGTSDPETFTTVAISSASYVQSGLVAQLDGFDNAGYGLHDATTNVWKDLVGSMDMTLVDGAAFGDSWLDVNGKTAQAAAKAPSYRTIEILCRMTNSTGATAFDSAVGNRYLINFSESGTRCNFARFWYGSGEKYLPLTYLATLDRLIAATYNADSTVKGVYVNGQPATTYSQAGAWQTPTQTKATLGSFCDGTSPWYGRIYALRLYNRTLTDAEVQLNGAVDMVRYQQADPATVFTGNLRWNAETRTIEARCAFATHGGEGGFLIGGVRTNEVWKAVGSRVELVYEQGDDHAPLEWHGLPTTSIVSNNLTCVAFDVSSAVTATLQLSRAGKAADSLIADGGFEEGCCYIHPYEYLPQVWTKVSNGSLGVMNPNDEAHGSFYWRPYQQNSGLTQYGLAVAAGDYILSYQYKCDTSGTTTAFGITGTNGTARTLSTVMSDSQNDGTTWHNVEADVTVAESGVYTFWFKNTSGGNCYATIDNVRLTSKANFTVDDVDDQPYLGERVKPTVVVRDVEGKRLAEDEDYEVTYGKNDGSGNGLGFVAVAGKGAYSGVVGRNFHIGTPYYVTPEGLATNDGTNWNTAVDFATALTKATGTSKHWEIWVAGSNVMTAAAVEGTTYKNIVIRGGFAGTEATPEERAPGAVGVLDGQNLYNIVSVKNFSGVNFERIRLINAPTRAVTKTGYAGGLKFRDCEFSANGANGGGATSFTGWRYNSNCYPNSVAYFTNCLFTANASENSTSASGGGIYANTMGEIRVDGCTFAENGVAGTYAYRKGAAIYTTLATVTGLRSEFRDNLGCSAGGIVQIEGYSKDNALRNCLFIGNEGMTSALTISPDSIMRKGEVVNCTFAYNTGCSTASAAGLQASVGQIKVWNSIFYGNTNGETDDAADLRGGASATLSVGYTMLSEDSAASYYFNNGASLTDSTCSFGDPLFVSETDAHLQSEQGYFDATGGVYRSAIDVRSPGIDAGDPTYEVGAEQSPNGEIINLGAYGGTRFASLTPVANPEITEIEVDWDAKYTQPTISVTAGGTGNYTASVTISVSTDGGATWGYESNPIGGVTKGSTKSLLIPLYFPTGSKIWIKAVIKGAGETDASTLDDVDVVGEEPPWSGKKGPANVIHVRPGATGLGDGTSWTDAADFETALTLVTDEKDEIWIAGTNLMSSVALVHTFSYPLILRGGFTGCECAASERAAGAVSTLDGQDLYDILNFYNTKAMTVERLVFTRGAQRGLKKFDSAGSITISNCTFVCNGRNGTCEQELAGNVHEVWGHGGAGLSIYGASSAKALVKDCRIEGNTTKSGTSSSATVRISNGCGAFFGSCRSAVIEGCSFVTNWPGKWTNTGGNAQALLFTYTPFAVTNCLFAGHTANAIGVRTVSDAQAATTNRIANCRFVGNKGCFFGTRDKAAPFLFENDTFAYNYGTQSVYFQYGTALFRNCIFWNVGKDLYAEKSGARIDFEWTLLADTNTTYVSGVSGATISFADSCLVGKDPLLVTSSAEAMAAFKTAAVRSDSYTQPSTEWLTGIDAHLRGRAGYFEHTGRRITFHQNSPAIDAGNPESDFSHEPDVDGIGTPGDRVNLGAYGNTPWATMSRAKGTCLRLR